MRGTQRYQAPEAFYEVKHTTTADIYSLGIVLLEVICGLSKVNHLREYKFWHPEVTRFAQSNRPELLPMLQEEAEDRYGAKNCLLNYSSFVGASGHGIQPIPSLPKMPSLMSWELDPPSIPAGKLPQASAGTPEIRFSEFINSQAGD